MKIYPYEAAAVKAKEGRLLKKSDLYQIAQAEDFKAAIGFLKDTDYGRLGINEENYEAVIEESLKLLYGEVLKSFDEKIAKTLLLKNDYYNLKLLIKSEILGEKAVKKPFKTGTVPTEELEAAFKNEALSQLEGIDGEAVKKAKEIFAKTNAVRFIDYEIDKAMFKEMKKAAKKSKIGFLIKYVSVFADITNIKAMYRILLFKRKRDDFELAFAEGGDLSFEFFRNVENIGFVKETEYASLFSGNISEFEKNCDDFVMDCLKKAKYESLGAEPLIGYFYARENEAENLKMILNFKKNGVSVGETEERIREAYE